MSNLSLRMASRAGIQKMFVVVVVVEKINVLFSSIAIEIICKKKHFFYNLLVVRTQKKIQFVLKLE